MAGVLYLKAEQKYVTVRTVYGEHLLETALGRFETEFAPCFVRIHRNFWSRLRDSRRRKKAGKQRGPFFPAGRTRRADTDQPASVYSALKSIIKI